MNATEPVTPAQTLDVAFDRLALHAAIYRDTSSGGILKSALRDVMRHTRSRMEPGTSQKELFGWAEEEAERRIAEQMADPRNEMFLCPTN